MISAVTDTSESTFDEVKLLNYFIKVTKFSKNGKFGQKRIF